MKGVEWGVFDPMSRGEQKGLVGTASMYRTAGRPEPSPRYITTLNSKGVQHLLGEPDNCPALCQESDKAYEAVVSERDDAKRTAATNRMIDVAAKSWVVVPIVEGMGTGPSTPSASASSSRSRAATSSATWPSACRAQSSDPGPDARPRVDRGAALHSPPAAAGRRPPVRPGHRGFRAARVTGNPADLLLPRTPRARTGPTCCARWAWTDPSTSSSCSSSAGRCAATSASRSATASPPSRCSSSGCPTP